jgi:hypothetical protein
MIAQRQHDSIEENALRTGQPSPDTMARLHRLDLERLAARRPDEAVRQLHQHAHSGGLCAWDLFESCHLGRVEQLPGGRPGLATALSDLGVHGDFRHGRDGVVVYSSAHVDYVKSELIVRGEHSCQNLPPTIEEVHRILHEHLDPAVHQP